MPFDGDITFSGNYTYEDTVCSAKVQVSAPEDNLVEQTEMFSVQFDVTSGNIIMDDSDISFFIIDNDCESHKLFLVLISNKYRVKVRYGVIAYRKADIAYSFALKDGHNYNYYVFYCIPLQLCSS